MTRRYLKEIFYEYHPLRFPYVWSKQFQDNMYFISKQSLCIYQLILYTLYTSFHTYFFGLRYTTCIKSLLSPLHVSSFIQFLSELWNLFGRVTRQSVMVLYCKRSWRVQMKKLSWIVTTLMCDDLAVAVMDNTEEGLQESNNFIAYCTSYADQR